MGAQLLAGNAPVVRASLSLSALSCEALRLEPPWNDISPPLQGAHEADKWRSYVTEARFEDMVLTSCEVDPQVF